MKIVNGLKYSQEQFEDYKVRYQFEFKVEERDYITNIDIYSNDTDKNNVCNIVSQSSSDKVISLELVHTSTKEQDDRDTEWLEEILKDI